MDIHFSYADHNTLLDNPLATIIDLTAISKEEADLILWEWQNLRWSTPDTVRIEQELTRIDPMLERVALYAFEIDPDLLRDAFRNTAMKNESLQFMGIVLRRGAGSCRYYFKTYQGQGEWPPPFFKVSDITFPKIFVMSNLKNCAVGSQKSHYWAHMNFYII